MNSSRKIFLINNIVFFLTFFFSNNFFSQSSDSFKKDHLTLKIEKLIKIEKFNEALLLLSEERQKKNIGPHDLKKINYFEGKVLSFKADVSLVTLPLWRSLNLKSPNKNYDRYYAILASYSLADLYYTCQFFDSAFYYAEKAIRMNQDQFLPDIFALTNELLIAKDYDSGNFSAAKKRAKIVFDFFVAKKNNGHIIVTSYKLMKVYAFIGSIDSAFYYLNYAKDVLNLEQKKLKLGTKIDQLLMYHKNVLFLAEHVKDLPKQIFHYQIIDSLQNLNSLKKEKGLINSLNIKLRTKEKELENKVLNKEVRSQYIFLFSLSVFMIGIIVFFMVNIRNKKKIEQLNEEMKTKNHELERKSLLHSKIFALLSHDFKGPIATLGLLLNKKNNFIENPTLINEYISDIRFQIENADNLLDSLLDWAKYELGTKTEEKYIVDLREFVEKICEQLHLKINEKNIHIVIEIPINVNLNFNSDVLKIILRNILSNAIKFSFDLGKIEISFKNNCISITDFGMGIEKDQITKLFNQKMDANFGTNKEIGFGIGLYFSAELLKKHRSKISVNSEIGNFTTFTISFDNGKP